MNESPEPLTGAPSPWWRQQLSNLEEQETTCSRPLRAGDACPVCGEGAIDYNGLFQLACPRCGAIVESGAFS